MYRKLLIFALIFYGVVAKEFTAVNSTITKVEIGGTKAEVARTFALHDIPEGLHSIVVEDLPSTVNEKSIEVSGTGDAQIVSTELLVAKATRENEVEYNHLAHELSNMKTMLKEQQSFYSDERALVVDCKRAIESFVQGILQFDKNRNDTAPVSSEQFLELIKLKRQEVRNANSEILLLNSKTKQVEELLKYVNEMAENLKISGYFRNWLPPASDQVYDAVPKDLADALIALSRTDKIWQASKESRTLLINIYVPTSFHATGRNLTFNLEYMAFPASWQAEYDLHVETRDLSTTDGNASTAPLHSMRVAMYAVVTQATKEDWPSVLLHLSTSQPQPHITSPAPPSRVSVAYKTTALPQPAPEPRHNPQSDVQIRPGRGMTHQGGSINVVGGSSRSGGSVRIVGGSSASYEGGDVIIESGAGTSGGGTLHLSGGSSSWSEGAGGDVFIATGSSLEGTSGSISLSGGSSQSIGRETPEQPPAQVTHVSPSHVSISGGASSIGSALTFHPEHRVNISSCHGHDGMTLRRHNVEGVPQLVLDDPPRRSTRMFIQDIVITPVFFTYAVPTARIGAGSAHLRAWTSDGSNDTASAQLTTPLLESAHARVFLEDTYSGTTSMPAVQPGSSLRLDLGQDRNVEVKSTFVLPRKSSQTEDKSTWFVTDKVKYKVEVVEYAFTVRSSHSAPHLVVLSEYLPHVGDEGIKVELLQPLPISVHQVTPASTSNQGQLQLQQQDVWTEEDFVHRRPCMCSPPTAPTTSCGPSGHSRGRPCALGSSTGLCGPKRRRCRGLATLHNIEAVLWK